MVVVVQKNPPNGDNSYIYGLVMIVVVGLGLIVWLFTAQSQRPIVIPPSSPAPVASIPPTDVNVDVTMPSSQPVTVPSVVPSATATASPQ